MRFCNAWSIQSPLWSNFVKPHIHNQLILNPQVEFPAGADLVALNTSFSVSCPDTEDDDDEESSEEFVYSLYYAVKGERKVYIGHTFDPSDFSADAFYLPPGLTEFFRSIIISWIFVYSLNKRSFRT